MDEELFLYKYVRRPLLTPLLKGNSAMPHFLCRELMPEESLQAERDNKSVYFQHIPAADTLAQTQPRRLVTATAYVLPAPADLVNEALMESFAEVPPDKVMPLLPNQALPR